MLFCAELPEYKAQECDRGKEQLEAELVAVGDEIFSAAPTFCAYIKYILITIKI